MIMHGLFSKHCALHMRLTNFEWSLNSLDHSAQHNEADVLSRTLVGLPSLGNDRGAAGSAPWRAGGFGPVAAVPRKQNESYIQRPTSQGSMTGMNWTSRRALCAKRLASHDNFLLSFLIPLSQSIGQWLAATSRQGRSGVLLCIKKVHPYLPRFRIHFSC